MDDIAGEVFCPWATAFLGWVSLNEQNWITSRERRGKQLRPKARGRRAGPEPPDLGSFVCSDMWKPYLKLIRKHCSEALHILDRFHVVANMNKALD